jgi:integrase
VWLPYESREGEGGGQVKTAWAGDASARQDHRFHPHDCRHTWATWHYIANRDIGALMRLGGWKTPAMVFRYTHINASDLAPSQAALWGKGGENLPAGTVKPMIQQREMTARPHPW